MNQEKFKKAYQKLNPEQKKAVDTLDGPVMVIAGPGTGKTEVLGLRIANLIFLEKAEPKEILALTFSESAAVSMRERVARFVGSSAYEVEIKTFHSFCNDIIRDNAPKFLFSRDLKHLDELGVVKRVKQILLKNKLPRLKPFYSPFHYQSLIIKRIDELKREGVTPSALNKVVQGMKQELEQTKEINKRTGRPKVAWQKAFQDAEKLEELVLVYEKYLELNQKRGEYDFSDMILWVIEKLREDEGLRSEYQEQFKYILSDEFQDTNQPQNEVIKILAQKGGGGEAVSETEANAAEAEKIEAPEAAQKAAPANVFVVGDDDQAIYRFQGASLDNIFNFEADFPGAKIIPIGINYRSGEEIVGAAREFIAKNEERLENLSQSLNESGITKDLKANPQNKGAAQVELAEFSNEAVETFYLGEKIKELNQEGIAFKDMAVLCRTNQEVGNLAAALIKAGISVEVTATGSILDKPEILNFLKLLRLVLNPANNLLLLEVFSWPVWGLDKKDFYYFFYSKRKNKNYLKELRWLETESAAREELAAHADKKTPSAELASGQENATEFDATEEISGDGKAKIRQLLNQLLAWHQAAAATPAALIVEQVLNESGILDDYLRRHDIQALNRFSSLFKFIKENNRQRPDLLLRDVLADLDIMQEDGIRIKEKELSMAADDVRLMTAHASKGMEFKVVFIPRLYQGNWDGKRNRESLKLPWPELGKSRADAGELAAKKEKKNKNIEEERRLFYVAMTRAKERLYLSRASEYASFGETKEKAPSVFLAEINRAALKIGDATSYEDAALARISQELKTQAAPKNLEQWEEDFLRSRVKELYLSPTGLNLYLRCPKLYKYEKLLFLPKTKSKQLCLGSAVHKALEEFFKLFMKTGKKDQELLIKVFKEALNQEIMLSDERQSALEEGERMLNRYFEAYAKEMKKPLALETKFNPVIFEGAHLTGTVDKVEALEGEVKAAPETPKTQAVKVIDYKTGKAHSRNSILGKTKNSTGDLFRQLVFYQLLSELDKTFPYKVKETELDFVKPNEKGDFRKESFVVTPDDLAKLKQEIETVVKKIKALDFGPTEDKRQCELCELREICQGEE